MAAYVQSVSVTAESHGRPTRVEHGVRRLDPLPSAAELAEFYTETYYKVNNGKAPDVARLRSESDAAATERNWRSETIYADVLAYLEATVGSTGRVIDVGCGTGEFISFMLNHQGWDAVGIEVAPDAVALAVDRGLDVRQGSISDVDREFGSCFDALTLFNVLEHVLDPWETLRTAHGLLRPGGVIAVLVPNDFSRLQEAVRQYLGGHRWWVAVPDHVNYFNFDSLESTLCAHGFEPLVRYGSFPMEFFLLGGFDYVTDPSQGAAAHHSRCAFELSMSSSHRRALFEDFARGGIGRNALVIARREVGSSD